MKNEKSALLHSLEMAGDKAKYDMQIKNILANKLLRLLDVLLSNELIEMVDNLAKKVSFKEVCELLEVTPEEYDRAEERIS